MVDQIELKPCPFCGGPPRKRSVRSTEFDDDFVVACGECGCRTKPKCFPHLAVEAWNTRTAYNPNERLMPSEASLERAWVWFLDANPDDVTSPEEYPDHALVTFKQMVGIVKEAALTEAEQTAPSDPDERLREALEFYADPENYHAISFMSDRPCGLFEDDFDEDHGHEDYDRPMPGKRARAAFARTSPSGLRE